MQHRKETDRQQCLLISLSMSAKIYINKTEDRGGWRGCGSKVKRDKCELDQVENIATSLA